MNYLKKIAKTVSPVVLERLADRLAVSNPDAAAIALQRAADLRAVPQSNQGGK